MRHFIATRPVATRSIGMSKPPQTTGLVTPSRQVLFASPRSPRAVARAIDLAAITATADQSLGDNPRKETASPTARHDVRTRYRHVDERHDCQDNAPACVPSTVWGTASRRNSQV